VLELVRSRYADFGPTLAHEKLVEEHGLGPSLETLRAWMTAAGLWQTRNPPDGLAPPKGRAAQRHWRG
jgi:hypothetical protein